MPTIIKSCAALGFTAVVLFCVQAASGQRIMVETLSGETTGLGVPVFEFGNFAISPDGSTIFASGLFDSFEADGGEFIYSFPIPANPATDTVTISQISVLDFIPGASYTVGGAPVVSNDGSTVFFANDRSGENFSISTVAADGSDLFNGTFNGFFSGPSTDTTGADNVVAGSVANEIPLLTPNGQNLLFQTTSATSGGPQTLVVTDSAGGGAVTQLSGPNDNVVFAGFDATDSIAAYAADNGQLFTVPIAGGTPTQIAIDASPNAGGFEVSQRLLLSGDSSTVFFIGDYLVDGRDELFSVPVAGGAPTRISADLVEGGNVTNFALSPDGESVAYAADKEFLNTNELFLADADGTGSSIRVSQAAPAPTAFDVSTDSGPGVIAFSPDSSQLFYTGDLETSGVEDLFVSDLSEQAAPVFTIGSAFTFAGPDGGDFFDESLFQEADGDNPAPDTINPSEFDDISIDLTIDGNSVVANGDIDVGDQGSGSITLLNNASLSIPGADDDLDIDDDASLVVADSTVDVGDNFFSDGPVTITNSTFDTGDDFELGGDAVVTGSDINAADLAEFRGTTVITDSNLDAGDDIEFEVGSDVTVTNTSIVTADFLELQATAVIADSTISADDDIEFEDGSDVTITNTTIAGGDLVEFQGGVTVITDSNFSAANDFEFEDGSNVTLTNTALVAADEVQFFDGSTAVLNQGSVTATGVGTIQFLSGSNVSVNGTDFTSQASDFEFQGDNVTTINGGSFTTTDAANSIRFQGFGSASSITGATFTTSNLSVENTGGVSTDVAATDSDFIVNGDINDAIGTDAGTLTLLGDSSLVADDLQEGFDLFLDDDSTAELGVDLSGVDTDDFLGDLGASVTLLSVGASLTIPSLDLFSSGVDPSDFIFAGLAGDSLSANPGAFSVTDLGDGFLISLVDLAGLQGDFSGDGLVNAADFTVFRDNFGFDEDGLAAGSGDGSGVVDLADFGLFANNFSGSLSNSPVAIAIPEPGMINLLIAAALTVGGLRKKRACRLN